MMINVRNYEIISWLVFSVAPKPITLLPLCLPLCWSWSAAPNPTSNSKCPNPGCRFILMNNISSSIAVCCFTSLSFFDTTPSNLKKINISVSLDPLKNKNSEPFLSLSFLHESALVCVVAKDKCSRASFLVPMNLREGYVAAHLYTALRLSLNKLGTMHWIKVKSMY